MDKQLIDINENINIDDNIDDNNENIKKGFNLTWDDLKGVYSYLKDNDFIRTGYRAGLNFKEATIRYFYFLLIVYLKNIMKQ